MEFNFYGEATSLLHLHEIGDGLILVGRGACLEFYQSGADIELSPTPLRRVECLAPESGLITKISALSSCKLHRNLHLIFAVSGQDCHIFSLQNPSTGVKTSKGLVITCIAVISATSPIVALFSSNPVNQPLGAQKKDELPPFKHSVVLAMGLQNNVVESVLLSFSARSKTTATKRVVTKQIMFEYQALPPRFCSTSSLLFSMNITSLLKQTVPTVVESATELFKTIQQYLQSIVVTSGTALRDVVSWNPFGHTLVQTDQTTIIFDNSISLEEITQVNTTKIHKQALKISLKDVDEDDEDDEGDLIELTMKDHGLPISTLLAARVEVDKMEDLLEGNVAQRRLVLCSSLETPSLESQFGYEVNNLSRCFPLGVYYQPDDMSMSDSDTSTAPTSHSQAIAKSQTQSHAGAALPMSHNGSIHQIVMLAPPAQSSASLYAVTVSDDRTVGLWQLQTSEKDSTGNWKMIGRANGFTARPYTVSPIGTILSHESKCTLSVAAAGEDSCPKILSFAWIDSTDLSVGASCTVATQNMILPDAGATIWKLLSIPITKQSKNLSQMQASHAYLYAATASGSLVKYLVPKSIGPNSTNSLQSTKSYEINDVLKSSSNIRRMATFPMSNSTHSDTWAVCAWVYNPQEKKSSIMIINSNGSSIDLEKESHLDCNYISLESSKSDVRAIEIVSISSSYLVYIVSSDGYIRRFHVSLSSTCDAVIQGVQCIDVSTETSRKSAGSVLKSFTTSDGTMILYVDVLGRIYKSLLTDIASDSPHQGVWDLIGILSNEQENLSKKKGVIPTSIAFSSLCVSGVSTGALFVGDSNGSIHVFSSVIDGKYVQTQSVEVPVLTSLSCQVDDKLVDKQPSENAKARNHPVLDITVINMSNTVKLYVLAKDHGVNLFNVSVSVADQQTRISFQQRMSDSLEHFQGENLYVTPSNRVLVGGFAEFPVHSPIYGASHTQFIVAELGLVTCRVICSELMPLGTSTRPWTFHVAPTSTEQFDVCLSSVSSIKGSAEFKNPTIMFLKKSIPSPLHNFLTLPGHSMLCSGIASITLQGDSTQEPILGVISVSDDETALLSKIIPDEDESRPNNLVPLQRLSHFPQPIKAVSVPTNWYNDDSLTAEYIANSTEFAFIGGANSTLSVLEVSASKDEGMSAAYKGSYSISGRPTVQGKLWLDDSAKQAQRFDHTDVRILAIDSIKVGLSSLNERGITSIIAIGSSSGELHLLSASKTGKLQTIWCTSALDSPVLSVKLFSNTNGVANDSRLLVGASNSAGRLMIWDLTVFIQHLDLERIPSVVLDIPLSTCAVNSIDLTTTLLPCVDKTVFGVTTPLENANSMILVAGLDSGDVILAILYLPPIDNMDLEQKIHMINIQVVNRHGSSVRTVRFPPSTKPTFNHGLIQFFSCSYDQSVTVNEVFAGLFAPYHFIVRENESLGNTEGGADDNHSKITFDTRSAPYGTPVSDLTSLAFVSGSLIVGGRGLLCVDIGSICDLN